MHFRIFETWRLTAAILVMLYHFLRYGPGDQYAISHMLERLLPLLDMFFMISGFLILLRYGDRITDRASYRDFILKRLVRFYPLYLATLVFFIAVGVAVHLGLAPSTQPLRYETALIPHNLLLIQAWGLTDHLSFNYVAWSLSAEWFCYLLLPVFVFAMARGGIVGLLLLAFVTIALMEAAILAGVMPFESWLKADTWGAYRAFADFALGGAVMLAVKTSRLRLASPLPAWLAFGLAIGAMLLLAPAAIILALLALAMFLAALSERNNPAGSSVLRYLSPAGAVSFGIYLLHPVIETILLAVVWRKLSGIGVDLNFYIYLAMPMTITVLVAMASDRWFEKPLANRILSAMSPPRPVGAG
ncbi:Peptidoglycan/LPS O-acetylase OafA/YrhL, contains acyltransferase and SGNH-hydrolase domains [Rhizobium sp. RU20A]|uniref:acyltransferase family protein n=1 Tax=Rhizobium sp. RU20A TaxID=1907412 RepID=UPI000953E0C6|nr:acyltransferase [Rhizobium sp. RU20A]SIQ76159.1 Peptidoglycan/LPS O-acetylase OafA/YrhL, contains acyltransferase and SGNH-hydrolase domains [Rhizobium sp. RU20A]